MRRLASVHVERLRQRARAGAVLARMQVAAAGVAGGLVILMAAGPAFAGSNAPPAAASGSASARAVDRSVTRTVARSVARAKLHRADVDRSVAREAALGASAQQIGRISYYADHLHGQPTAAGHMHDRHALTMAHRHWPFGTRVRVTELQHGRQVVVVVDDRGPWRSGRVADVSHEAARRLGMLHQGTVRARLDRLDDAVATTAAAPASGAR